MDSLPVPVCDNIRIRRCRLYPCPKPDKEDRKDKKQPKLEGFRGYVPSKRRYFYGLKVHLLVTAAGLPVEVMLAPGSQADVSAFKCLPMDPPAGAHVFADAITRTDIIGTGVAQHVLQRMGAVNVFTWPADDDREFAFVVHLFAGEKCRDQDGGVRPLYGVQGFGEYNRVIRDFGPEFFGMTAVVQADAQNGSRHDRGQ